MPDTAAYAPVFAALGDPTRLALLERLNDGESHSIARLSEGLTLSRQGVTKHLDVMARAGLVSHRRVGRESLYRLQPDPLVRLQGYLDQVAGAWEDALQRLRLHVEESPD